jgi:hypothetical protein
VGVAAVPVAWAEWTGRAIRDRRRPVLAAEAMAADQAVRRAAGRSTAWLELALALLTVSWALPITDLPAPWLVMETLIGFGSLGCAFWAFARSSVRAPRSFRRRFDAALAGGRSGSAPAAGAPPDPAGPNLAPIGGGSPAGLESSLMDDPA